MKREIYYSEDKTKVVIISPIGDILPLINRVERPNNLLVIGNGFDLSLGLKTTYRDFVNSSFFENLFEKRTKEKVKDKNPQPSLIDYLNGKKFQEKWYDIEAAILEYVSRKPDGSFVDNVKEDKKDYEKVCEALVEYLANLFDERSIDANFAKRMMESPAGKLLWKINSRDNIIYSFNYTPIERIIKILGDSHLSSDTVRVHGEIKEDTLIKGKVKDNAIILGIEVDDINSIAPGYSFLLKSNNAAYKSTDIASDLLNSQNVIFFGHSLNQMDFGYFEDYFKILATNTDKERTLTIITKDESSRITILDNIRKMGISVREMFTHTKVQYILTDKLYRDKKESEKFDKLIKSL